MQGKRPCRSRSRPVPARLATRVVKHIVQGVSAAMRVLVRLGCMATDVDRRLGVDE